MVLGNEEWREGIKVSISRYLALLPLSQQHTTPSHSGRLAVPTPQTATIQHPYILTVL